MARNPQSKVTYRENVNVVIKCPCPSISLVRRNERPVLANIQGEATRSQHLSVQGHGTRRKSDSCCTQGRPSPAANVCHPVKSELKFLSSATTWMVPTIREPLRTSIQKEMFQHTSGPVKGYAQALPARPNSTSSYEKTLNAQNRGQHVSLVGQNFKQDDVTSTGTKKATGINQSMRRQMNYSTATVSTFLQPTNQSVAYGLASSTVRSNASANSTQHVTPIGRNFTRDDVVVTSTGKRNATEINQSMRRQIDFSTASTIRDTTSSGLPMATSTFLQPTNQSVAYGSASSTIRSSSSTDSCEKTLIAENRAQYVTPIGQNFKQDDVFVTSTGKRKITGTNQSMRKQLNYSTASTIRKTTSSGLPMAGSTFLQLTNQSVVTVTNSSCSTGSTIRRNLNSEFSGYSTRPTLRAGSLNSTTASTIKGCCSSKTIMANEKNNETLPAQHFVTLTQDTLNPTSCSRIDSMIAKKVNIVRDSSYISADITPNFVDGEGYFRDVDQGKCASTRTVSLVPPIDTALPIRRSNSISETSFRESDGSRRPAVKMTLRMQKNQIVFPLLYCPYYMKNIIAYSDSHRYRLLLDQDVVQNYMHKRNRNVAVNWLLQLCDYVVPLFPPVYYLSVRLFDFAIIRLKVRAEYYRLVAVVSFWISLKYLHQDKILKVSKIQAFCKGHTKDEVYSMEKKILRAVCFCLNVADPLDFLYYYLKMVQLETDELLRYASEYVLQCATLFETYSTHESPFVAACSVYFAVTQCSAASEHLNEHLLKCVRYNAGLIQPFVEDVLTRNVRKVAEEKLAPFEHFMRAEKLRVARIFRDV